MNDAVTTPAGPTYVHVGGPTGVLEYGGVRIVTDPTFDAPGTVYNLGPLELTKTDGPAVALDELGDVDVVLLSHDQHPDNFDGAGRAVAGRARHVLTTEQGASRVPDAVGLKPWQSHEVEGDVTVTVTAAPAQHGPTGTAHLTGDVIGFVLEAPGLPTVYISGDNVSLDAVGEVAGERSVDVAVLHGGAAQLAPFGPTHLSMPADSLVEAARVLGAKQVIAVHADGWSHFTESGDDVRRAFDSAGLGEVLVNPAPGTRTTL